MAGPKSLIINTPYERPQRHWQQQADGSLAQVDGRRQASYDIYDVRNNTRRVEVLEQVNDIRQRVDDWRADEYPGTTAVSRQLLAHWHDRTARTLPFYFCQLEAIETLIWWVEAVDKYRQGVHLQGAGGAWERLCSKMATGAGKTAVMAMIITWQVLNALTYPKRNGLLARHLHRRARPHRQGTAARAVPRRTGQRLRRIRALPLGRLAPAAEPGRGAGGDLAHADAAEGGRPLGGEEGQGKRRGLHPARARQAGRVPRPRGDQ